jgi:hypothetical protein
VTIGWHNLRFRTRLRQAATRAEMLGHADLATILRKDADGYDPGNGPNVEAVSYVYQSVRDNVREMPSLTLDDIVYNIADDFGLTGPEVLARYRRLPTIYKRTQRGLIREERRVVEYLRAAGDTSEDIAHMEASIPQRLHALASLGD